MLFSLILGCSSPRPAPAPTPAEPTPTEHASFDATDASACVSCHRSTVDEWSQSMHSRAHPSNDPIYAGMRALRIKKQGAAVGAKCQRCHNPMAPDSPDSPAGRAGVGCGSCHTMSDVDAGVLPDPRQVCLTCHDAGKNPNGAATCTTGPENTEAGGPTCGSCHMPPTGDRRHAHTFRGPHRAWYQDDPSFLKSAVSVALTRKDGKIGVTVINLTGHAFPTGFPGRLAQIRLHAEGWESTPDALQFKKVYVDAAGKPTMPPLAVELKLDTRLKPGETREVWIDGPPGAIDAELVFHLLPPSAAAKIGVSGLEAEKRSIPLAHLD